jgi:hypothetical protein
MLSFFTKKDRDDEDENDEARSKDAIERILVKLQEAEAWIPPRLTNDQKQDPETKQNTERIISLCETIKGAINVLKTEKSDDVTATSSGVVQTERKPMLLTTENQVL